MATKTQVNTSNVSAQQGEGLSRRTVVRAPNGTLWVLFVDDEAIATRDLLVAYSSDNGATWTEEGAVTDDRPKLTNPFPMLLINSSGVPIIIYEKSVSAGTDQLRYADRSGGSWQSPETIREDNNIQEADAVMDSSDAIHIVYYRSGVYYIKGSTGSWSSPEAIPNAGAQPSIAIDDNDKPYVVTVDKTGDTGIFMFEKTGASWSAAETIENTNQQGSRPTCAMDTSNNLHVTWRDNDGNSVILYRKRSSAGSWGTEIEVLKDTDDPAFEMPYVSVDPSGNAYVVYNRDVDPADNGIYYKKITGTTLGSEQTIDATLTRPGGASSFACSLYHRYPSSGVLASTAQPAIIALDADTDATIYYESGPIANVFPSDTVARVSAIRHIFRPGFFRMQVGLGDMGFDIDVAEATVRSELDTAKEAGIVPPPPLPTKDKEVAADAPETISIPITPTGEPVSAGAERFIPSVGRLSPTEVQKRLNRLRWLREQLANPSLPPGERQRLAIELEGQYKR